MALSIQPRGFRDLGLTVTDEVARDIYCNRDETDALKYPYSFAGPASRWSLLSQSRHEFVANDVLPSAGVEDGDVDLPRNLAGQFLEYFYEEVIRIGVVECLEDVIGYPIFHYGSLLRVKQPVNHDVDHAAHFLSSEIGACL